MDKKKIIIGASAIVGLVAIIWAIKNRKKLKKGIMQGNPQNMPAKKLAIEELQKSIYDSKKNFCDAHTSTFYSATCSPSAINNTTYLRMQAMDEDLKKATAEEIKLYTKYSSSVVSGTILSQPNIPYSDYQKLMVLKDKYPSWGIS